MELFTGVKKFHLAGALKDIIYIYKFARHLEIFGVVMDPPRCAVGPGVAEITPIWLDRG
jgi:hypothetical protein